MSKHTPGPWYVIEKENGTLGIGAKEPDGEECRPAQINGTAIEEPWASVTWANARLIAAAPELLAVAEKLFDEPCNCQGPPEHAQWCRGCLARAAIAKATGQEAVAE